MDSPCPGYRERSRVAGICPEPSAQAVFRVLERNVSRGQTEDVRNALHEEVREILREAE